ncbi:hypothetical protein BC826DRAFT_971559 [Russula brevipes]|nr:hypothetical protein BC826DRAFT_971559 [Russula brevipes]
MGAPGRLDGFVDPFLKYPECLPVAVPLWGSATTFAFAHHEMGLASVNEAWQFFIARSSSSWDRLRDPFPYRPQSTIQTLTTFLGASGLVLGLVPFTVASSGCWSSDWVRIHEVPVDFYCTVGCLVHQVPANLSVYLTTSRCTSLPLWMGWGDKSPPYCWITTLARLRRVCLFEWFWRLPVVVATFRVLDDNNTTIAYGHGV